MRKVFRTCSLVAALVAAVVIVSPWNPGGSSRASAQSAAPQDSAASAKEVARAWAFKLFQQIEQTGNQDKRMTFQPMAHDDVRMSEQHRRRLYRWMLEALHEVGSLVMYAIINPTDPRVEARALEEAGVSKWDDLYIETLQKQSLTKLNLSCQGTPQGNRVKLDCAAVGIGEVKSYGRASAVFDLKWLGLGTPMAMEPALDAVAGDIVAGLRRSGGVDDEIKIVDHRTGGESHLAISFARSLKVRIIRRLHERRGGSLPGPGSAGEALHRLEVGIEHRDDKLVLQVTVYLNDRPVNAVEQDIALASVPEEWRRLATDPGPGGTQDAEVVVPPDDDKHERNKYLAGVDRAFLVRDYARVLSYVEKLDELGVAVPERVHHYRGVASFYMSRMNEAAVALRRYVEAVGQKGKYYNASLLLVLELEEQEDAVFARAESQGTEKGYQEYLDVYPRGRYAGKARRRWEQLVVEAADHAAFSQSQLQDTVASYQEYVSAYPNGAHTREAQVRRRELELDHTAFSQAESLGTVVAYQGYLEAYPKGRHAREAMHRRDELLAEAADHAAFARAEKLGTVKAYQGYLDAYPGGAHVKDAKRRKDELLAKAADRAAFTRAEKLGTVAAYQRYLEAYPEGAYAREAKRGRDRLVARAADRAAFARAQSRDTVAAYREYLAAYPKGSHVREARVRMEKLELDHAAFARAESQGTEEGYLEYLEAYPDGRHAGEAKRRREELLAGAADHAAFAQAQDTVEAYEAYLGKYPHGIHADEVRRRRDELIADREAFAQARSADTPASYDRYLVSYPNGRHLDEARRRRADAMEREAALAEANLDIKPLARIQIEQGLASAGMDVGRVDGEFTEQTRAALRSWQAAEGADGTGYLTRDQAVALTEEGKVFRDCGECPEMVFVPAGSFMMGSESYGEDERPEHRVTISAPLAVGKYEATFAEWDACARDGGCEAHPEDHGWGRGRRPVVGVTWAQARGYTDWLSRRTGKEYRLLSESEWEYVARAGSTTDYWWGDEIGKRRANCNGCGSRWDDKETAPAGSFQANAFGLYDVHGNLWEWVEDCWKENYRGVPSDGSAWQRPEHEACPAHVIRGGSWNDWPVVLRLGHRKYDNLTWYSPRQDEVGFRVARTLAR